MYNHANGSVTICLRLNGSKIEQRNNITNKIENIKDEEQLDRIFTRSDELVYTGYFGAIPAKRVIIQDLMFTNPYVLLIAKIATEEEADIIREYEELSWKDKIESYKTTIKNIKFKNDNPYEPGTGPK